MAETYQYAKKVSVTDADQLISLPVLADLNINNSLVEGDGNDVSFSFDGDVDSDSKPIMGGASEYIKMPKSIFLHLKCASGKTTTVFLTGRKQFKS